MSDVSECYQVIRRAIKTAVLPQSPLDKALTSWLTDHPLPPGLLLPIAAAGGKNKPAIAISASMGYLLLTMRWLDDLVDQDREGQLWQETGPGVAAVLSSSALTHAWACLANEPGIPRDVLVAFGDMTAVLALGEYADAQDPPVTIAEWQRIAWRKTAVCYRFACWAGARLTGVKKWEKHASLFGEYMGLYLQAMDDISGAFDNVAPDLTKGVTYTLPLVKLVSFSPDALHAFNGRDIKLLQEEFKRWDIRSHCEKQASAYAEQAQHALTQCTGPWDSACGNLLAFMCGSGEVGEYNQTL